MELTAQKREIFGKKVKTLEKQGLIPAEFYGQGIENLHLTVLAKNFSKVFKEAGESAIVKLNVDGKHFNVLIHDIDQNPFTDKISHIDFYGVRMDKKIKIKIPLSFINESLAVKEKIGVLVKAMHEIEVEALPADLPHHIEVDLSPLATVGSSILVKDLKIGEKAKILVDEHTVVASITELAKEEEIAPTAEMKVEDVKVETEEKKEARAEAKEIKEKEEKK